MDAAFGAAGLNHPVTGDTLAVDGCGEPSHHAMPHILPIKGLFDPLAVVLRLLIRESSSVFVTGAVQQASDGLLRVGHGIRNMVLDRHLVDCRRFPVVDKYLPSIPPYRPG